MQGAGGIFRGHKVTPPKIEVSTDFVHYFFKRPFTKEKYNKIIEFRHKGSLGTRGPFRFRGPSDLDRAHSDLEWVHAGIGRALSDLERSLSGLKRVLSYLKGPVRPKEHPLGPKEDPLGPREGHLRHRKGPL